MSGSIGQKYRVFTYSKWRHGRGRNFEHRRMRPDARMVPGVTQEMSDAMVRKGASMARAQDRHRISRYGNLIKLLPGRAVGLCRCHDTCATLRGY
jgi:hypothetical protein